MNEKGRFVLKRPFFMPLRPNISKKNSTFTTLIEKLIYNFIN